MGEMKGKVFYPAHALPLAEPIKKRIDLSADVPITVTNADTLRRNGFIIVSGLDDLPSVRIYADVPQKNYNSSIASNYNLRIDTALPYRKPGICPGMTIL